MARAATAFVCDACRGHTAKWQGQCPHCGEWNTLSAGAAAAPARGAAARRGGSRPLVAANPAVPLGSNLADDAPAAARWSLGLEELDRVLGGGLTPGSVTLIGGEPGIGKSTLLLQAAAHLGRAQPVLYVSGEESAAQVGLRARRLGLGTAGVHAVCETDLDAVLELARQGRTQLLVVDSIQTMALGHLEASAGAVTQLRECTAELVRHAKSSGCAVILVGHVTKDGAIAGPRLLEHLVDTVLYFEREAGSRFRRVRAAKNRFGNAQELGFFLMTEAGLKEVRNPSAIFLARSPEPVAGSVVTVTRDGNRPLLVEVQGLVDRTRFAAPRRVAQGLDAGRLSMLLAVLHRHAGVALQEHDVFANVVGGLTIDEPGADLPTALALVSSLKDQALDPRLIAFGELGLTGEVRPVAYGEERLREAAKQGFTSALVPKDNQPRTAPEGMKLIPVTRVEQALAAVLRGADL